MHTKRGATNCHYRPRALAADFPLLSYEGFIIEYAFIVDLIRVQEHRDDDDDDDDAWLILTRAHWARI